jgi:hypothetical protein
MDGSRSKRHPSDKGRALSGETAREPFTRIVQARRTYAPKQGSLGTQSRLRIGPAPLEASVRLVQADLLSRCSSAPPLLACIGMRHLPQVEDRAELGLRNPRTCRSMGAPIAFPWSCLHDVANDEIGLCFGGSRALPPGLRQKIFSRLCIALGRRAIQHPLVGGGRYRKDRMNL